MKTAAFIFPGQGSQYQGMGKTLYQNDAGIRDLYEKASNITGIDLKRLCLEADASELVKTKNAQLSIFCASYAMFLALKKKGVKAQYMAGHSLGEITALTCAGAINFEDAVKIVQIRGCAMQEAADHSLGKMYAVMGADISWLNRLCEQLTDELGCVTISNYNSVDQVVVSGNMVKLSEVSKRVMDMGGKCIELNVSAPFHSPLMKDASLQFSKELKQFEFHDFNVPVISNVTGKGYESPSEIAKTLAAHIVRPVLWKDTMDFFLSHSVDFALEVGPKEVLTRIMRKYTNRIKTFSFDCETERQLMESYFDDLTASNTAVTLCLKNAVCVPNSNWDKREYQSGVVEPYKRLREIQMLVEKEKRSPTACEDREAMELLKTIFFNKKVPLEEQEARINQIQSIIKQM